MLGGAAGGVNPITPLPVAAQLAAAALQEASNLKQAVEVDLNRHQTPPKSWIFLLFRSKNDVKHSAAVRDFDTAVDSCRPGAGSISRMPRRTV